MRLGVVVDRDPGGRCSQPVGATVEIPGDEPFVIGRDPVCDLVVDDRAVNKKNCGVTREDHGWVLTDYRGANGVWVNGEHIRGRHKIAAGDVLTYPSGVVLRFVVVEPLSALCRVGSWVLLGASRPAVPFAGPAFRLTSDGPQRGWLVSSADDDAAAFSGSAGTRPALPALVDAFADKRAVHRVYDVDDHVDLLRFCARAAPASPQVTVRVGLELCRAVAAVYDATGRQLARWKAGVTFAGRVVVVPSPSPLSPPEHATDVHTGPIVEVLAALQPQQAPLRALAWPERWRLPFTVLDEGLRRVAHDVGVASDEEVAGAVCGLFPDEHAAAALLHEQLETLDDAAVERMMKQQ